MDDDDVSTKSIVIFTIEVGIWVIRACPMWGTVQWSEIHKLIGSIDFITHLQYDKLWGLPRRVFTLLESF